MARNRFSGLKASGSCGRLCFDNMGAAGGRAPTTRGGLQRTRAPKRFVSTLSHSPCRGLFSPFFVLFSLVSLCCFVLFCFGLCLLFCCGGLFSPAFVLFAFCCFVFVLLCFVRVFCCIEGPRSAPLPSRPVPSPPLSSPSSLSPRPPSVYFLAAATSHRRAGHGGAQRRARLSRLEQLLRRSLHSCWLEGPLGRAQPVGIDRKAPGAAHNMAVNRFFAELPPVAC